MATSLGIGLTLSSPGQPFWPSQLPRIGGALPDLYLNTDAARFARLEAGKHIALSASQLAARISSTGPAQVIADGIGGDTNLSISENGLPMSFAGLQAHPTVTRLHGVFPANGTDNGAISGPLATEGIFSPWRIVSDGAIWHRRRSTAFSTVAGTPMGFAVLWRAGQGNHGRITFYNTAAGTTTISDGAIGAIATSGADFGPVTNLSQTQFTDGNWLVTGVFTPNATLSGAAELRIGPDGATAGDYVDVLCAQVTNTPYSYADWIIGGTGAATLAANRTTLGFGGGAFAFVAEINLKGLTPGSSVRLLDWNDGSATNRISLAKGGADVFSMQLARGGYIGQAAAGSYAGAGVMTYYGVAADNYVRLGSTDVADSPVNAGLGAMPTINTLAFDGVGYDNSTDRAYKYLKRFCQWPLSAGSDAVFNAAKAIAQDWAA
ncbi:MAG: hypothetical protein KKH72_09885 [Alphaproteobacteria bacterium]|nr:hypothetical protein [Alphaproteobacteria bacterium]